MQLWSDELVHPKLTTRFFIDTNILVYLIDNSYQSLSDFFDIVKDFPFVELVSSKYVIFEFVGVRKREHYLRLAADRCLKMDDGTINFSSLLKYKDGYNIPKAAFEDLALDIKNEVNSEVERIATEFNIKYEYSSLHEDQLAPTFDVCLTSKISNQDSLVLVSSVLPEPKTSFDNIILLTNDSGFVSSFASANIGETLQQHDISSPKTFSIEKITYGTGQFMNLIKINDRDDLTLKIINFILETVIERQGKRVWGRTFLPKNSLPEGVVCFKLDKNITVKENFYITIVSHNLDFIYTSKTKIPSLHFNGNPLQEGYTSPADQKINVAFKLVDLNELDEEVPLNTDIIRQLRAPDNYIMLHPDS